MDPTYELLDRIEKTNDHDRTVILPMKMYVVSGYSEKELVLIASDGRFHLCTHLNPWRVVLLILSVAPYHWKPLRGTATRKKGRQSCGRTIKWECLLTKREADLSKHEQVGKRRLYQRVFVRTLRRLPRFSWRTMPVTNGARNRLLAIHRRKATRRKPMLRDDVVDYGIVLFRPETFSLEPYLLFFFYLSFSTYATRRLVFEHGFASTPVYA